MQDIKNNLGSVIRKYRLKAGFTQEQLAERLGFGDRTILNIENGKGNPKFDRLYPIIAFLNIPADEIFYPGSKTTEPYPKQLSIEIGNCTEEESETLLPVFQELLKALRKHTRPSCD